MNETLKHIRRYLIVGVLTNSTGYAAYLAFTFLGMDTKIAMTGIYFVAAFLGYWGNKSYTFTFSGGIASSSCRYIIAHTVGYGLNLCLLLLFSDVLGYPHQIVQFIAIFIVAAFLFVMNKFFVFAPSKNKAV